MIERIIAFTICCLIAGQLFAQIPDSILINRSKKMANLFRDSLRLSNAEYKKIANINYEILKEKTVLMKSDSSRNYIVKQVQRVENTRDSLYQTVLPSGKFFMYRRLKPLLLSAQ